MDTKELLKIIEQLSGYTEKRIVAAIAALEKQNKGLQSELLNLLLQDFVSKITLKEGKIELTAANLAKVSELDKLFSNFKVEFIDDQMSKFTEELLQIAELNGEYYAALGFDQKVVDGISKANELIKARIGVTGSKNAIVPGGYLDTLAQTAEVKQVLKNIVISQITTTRNVQEFTKAIGNFVKGTPDVDGALVRYYRQYAYDSYNQVLEVKNQEFAKGLGLKWFIYVGSVIQTTRPFCSKRAGKVFSTDEAETWKNDPDLIQPSTSASYNPLLERGRYNCRHMIKYVSEEMARRLAPDKFGGTKQPVKVVTPVVPTPKPVTKKGTTFDQGIAVKINALKGITTEYKEQIITTLSKLKDETGFEYISYDTQNRSKSSTVMVNSYNRTTKESRLIINIAKFKTRTLDEENIVAKKLYDSGWWMAQDFNGILAHEFGHLLTLEKMVKYGEWDLKVAAREAAKTSSIYANTSGIKRTTDGREVAAEIFAKYFHTGISGLNDEEITFFNKYSKYQIK
jgi:hypothetical protein